MQPLYLDYCATAPLDKRALEKMLPYLTEQFGNADSLHSFGRKTAYAVTTARDLVAQTLGVQASEIYFTSGGTESDNFALRVLSHVNGDGVLLSNIEHHALLGAGELFREAGGEVVFAEADESGIVTAEAVERAITPNTKLVCVMAVNNETGCIQPLKEISEICKRKGVLLFSDCVQAGNALDLREICACCDMASFSAHKLYGPKGVGALFVRKGVKMQPLIAGGEQERSLRGGTLNVAGIVGFAEALSLAQAQREEFSAHTLRLRDYFESELKKRLGEEMTVDGKNRISSVSHITFRRGGEAFLSLLDLRGIACSGGAACSAHAALPSHVLLAMGRSEETAKKGVRFSFGRDTKREEVETAVSVIVECYRSLF